MAPSQGDDDPLPTEPACTRTPAAAMKRVLRAPNLALATLWADQLSGVGVTASVQRAHAASIAGEAPPDQCLPEVWVQDDDQAEHARHLLDQWQHLPHRRWACHSCGEVVEGPFDCCWNCGQAMPAAARPEGSNCAGTGGPWR